MGRSEQDKENKWKHYAQGKCKLKFGFQKNIGLKVFSKELGENGVGATKRKP